MKLPKLILSAFLTLTVAFPAASAPAAYAAVTENDASAIISSSYEASSSIEAAAKDLRQHLRNRDTSFTVSVDKDAFDWGFPPESVMTDIEKIAELALADTGVPTEGDYIRWNFGGYQFKAKESGNVLNIEYTASYHTTAAQEKAVDSAVNEIISSLDIGKGSDLEKVHAVYDWLTSKVKYADSIEDDRVFSAYGAAVQKKAVCQGYSVLAYRLLTELGVKCRVVPGTGNSDNHTWNLVNVDGKNYYFDATWEAQTGAKEYIFLLRGKDDFDEFAGKNKHIFNEWEHDYSPLYVEYDNGSFEANYPVSSSAYKLPASYFSYSLGDIDSNGHIDSTDATYVLTAYSKLSTVGRSGLRLSRYYAADVDISGIVDSKDASWILGFYAFLSTGGNGTITEFMKNRR